MGVEASLGLLLLFAGVAVIVFALLGLLWSGGDRESRGYAVFLLGPVPLVLRGGGRLILISIVIFLLVVVSLLLVI